VSRVACLLAVLLALPAAGCGGEDDAAPATTAPATTTDTTATAPQPGTETDTAPSAETGAVTIETGEGTVVVSVEIADSDAEREVGLMGRDALADDSGMLFVFEEDVDFGFWMKDTLIPLSIAFADADGEIVRILDMDPCEADPCPVYDPEATYRTALEVNQGAFSAWGVAEGDRMTLDR
jgi:uncharacterized protein